MMASAERQAFLRDVQRLCAEELAKCVREMERQSKAQQQEWRAAHDSVLVQLRADIDGLREQMHNMFESSHDDQESVFETIHERITALEHNVAELKAIESPTLSISAPSSPLPAKEVDCTPLQGSEATMALFVAGEQMDTSCLDGMNLTTYVLQFARIHRGMVGIFDETNGVTVPFAEAIARVQAVSAGLEKHGFRAGSVLCVDSSMEVGAYGFRLVVLFLAVWRINATVRIVDHSNLEITTMEEAHWLLSCGDVLLSHESARVLCLSDMPQSVLGCFHFRDLTTAAETKSSSVFSTGVPSYPAVRLDSLQFSHAQLIGAVERSLHALESSISASTPNPLMIATLSLTEVTTWTTCVLPAIVHGLSIILAPNCTSKQFLDQLVKQKAQIAMVPPSIITDLSDCKSLQLLKGTSLHRLVYCGAPLPVFPKFLKCLATASPDLQCQAVLPLVTIGGPAFVTDDLLQQVRSKTNPAYQALGRPCINISCFLRRIQGANRSTMDLYDVLVGLEEAEPVLAGIACTVSWEKRDGKVLNVAFVSSLGGQAADSAIACPTLPIEEVFVSHPLVTDVHVVRRSSHRRTPIELDVYLSLTPSARKYEADSLVTIQSYLAKKFPVEDIKCREFHLVSHIPRDNAGRTLINLLLAVIREEKDIVSSPQQLQQ